MTIPRNFYVDFPEGLVNNIKENENYTLEIGINWRYKQCEDLLNNGVKTIHHYIMTKTNGATSVLDK